METIKLSKETMAKVKALSLITGDESRHLDYVRSNCDNLIATNGKIITRIAKSVEDKAQLKDNTSYVVVGKDLVAEHPMFQVDGDIHADKQALLDRLINLVANSNVIVTFKVDRKLLINALKSLGPVDKGPAKSESVDIAIKHKDEGGVFVELIASDQGCRATSTVMGIK